MQYIEYEKYKEEYNESKEVYKKIFNRKSELFYKALPSGTAYDKLKTSGTIICNNKFLEYVDTIKEERLDDKLEEAKKIMAGRKELLEAKEKELRESKDWYDMLYVYKKIENKTVKYIKIKMPFCKSSIYEMLKKIEKK